MAANLNPSGSKDKSYHKATLKWNSTVTETNNSDSDDAHDEAIPADGSFSLDDVHSDDDSTARYVSDDEETQDGSFFYG